MASAKVKHDNEHIHTTTSCEKDCNKLSDKLSGVPPDEVLVDNLHVGELPNETASFEKECDDTLRPAEGLVDNIQAEELPNETLPDKVLNVPLGENFVERPSVDDSPVVNRPRTVRHPKEEPLDNFKEACEDFPTISLRVKIPYRFPTKTSSEESPVSTPNENSGRSRIYWLRRMSGGKQEVESEEEKGSQDGCEESNSEDTNPYGFTFCNQSYLRGSVTIKAVVKYTIDNYDMPHSITGRIVQILQHGLLYGTSDADARKAVKDAQRRLTKYNLKQVMSNMSSTKKL
ncbi:hypothetical protein GOP47_0028455 [Adiantum capillus-veneris]|nr:hypothetical protein GOP47_0028455 [Adiantum capillus-veneris]